MGSHLNFKNFGNGLPLEGDGRKPQGNNTLTRQPSVYSLTFDELQTTFSGLGKDFGSMNMDELLRSIWTAEETQAMTPIVGGGQGSVPNGNLQRQGSLTLPRTLSQKTVEKVWKDLLKENGGMKDESGGSGGSNFQQRQQTLGEITLEEFLVRAGVVREETQQIGRPNNSAFYGELLQTNNNTDLAIGFQQPAQDTGVSVKRLREDNNSVANHSPRLAVNMSGTRSVQQQRQPQLQQQQQHHPIFPKQATVAFASPMQLVNGAPLASQGNRGAIVGTADPSMNNGLVQGGGLHGGGMGLTSFGAGNVTVAAGSPANQFSSDVTRKSNVDTSSLSPAPYVYNQGLRGRKCSGTLEKVVERRHRRMIKNRESAARSRARKQAYTVELEAEVAKLKEVIEELQKKQEHVETQKNQILDRMTQIWGGKRRCLRRTLTGPW